MVFSSSPVDFASCLCTQYRHINPINPSRIPDAPRPHSLSKYAIPLVVQRHFLLRSDTHSPIPHSCLSTMSTKCNFFPYIFQ